jgi:hypothetical protein
MFSFIKQAVQQSLAEAIDLITFAQLAMVV